MAEISRVLYRPVGFREMELILEADNRAFPPRLPEQPLFYPVLNFAYAEQIARDWNTKDAQSGFAGFVTTFHLDTEYLDQFEEHTVGSATHRELWIPSDQLEKFNQHILGHIQITAAYYGVNYKRTERELFIQLHQTWLHSRHDFDDAITHNRNAILLNYACWIENDVNVHITSREKRLEFLQGMQQHWQDKFPDIHLFGSELFEQLNPTDRMN